MCPDQGSNLQHLWGWVDAPTSRAIPPEQGSCLFILLPLIASGCTTESSPAILTLCVFAVGILFSVFTSLSSTSLIPDPGPAELTQQEAHPIAPGEEWEFSQQQCLK